MENISQMSMLEAAINLMEQKKNPQPINKILEETLELKGLDDPNGELAAQLYVDITTSSKFVYMGNEEWDLKSRQSLDWWDKDGSAFNTAESTDNDLSTADFDYDEDKEEDSDDDYSSDDVNDDYAESEEDDEYSDNDEYDRITDNPDEDFDEENDFDEDDYEGYMDDYENLYDK